MINVDEEPTENVKMKKIVEKKFLKKKENSDTMMFEIVDVKNLNAEIFMKYYINDTTTISSSFTKFSFKFESFLKKKSATQTYEKKQKKEKHLKKTRTKALRKRKRRRQMNKFLFFV